MNEYNFDIDNVRNNVNARDDPRGNVRGNAINVTWVLCAGGDREWWSGTFWGRVAGDFEDEELSSSEGSSQA